MIMLEVDGQEVTSISRRNAVTVAYCHTAPVVTAATRHSLVCSTNLIYLPVVNLREDDDLGDFVATQEKDVEPPATVAIVTCFSRRTAAQGADVENYPQVRTYY